MITNKNKNQTKNIGDIIIDSSEIRPTSRKI